MNLYVVVLGIVFESTVVKTRMLPKPYQQLSNARIVKENMETEYREKLLSLRRSIDEIKSQEDGNFNDNFAVHPNEQCAILVMSDHGSTNVHQSLLRKYRYNRNGELIPGSVQYFIKFPQGKESAAVLVPLKDRAFSQTGGFVKYYKEVPPIPQSWV